MYEYFPENYTWSLAVMSALNRGGQIAEVHEACRPLRDVAKRKDPAAQEAWFQNWMRVAERVERLADADTTRNHLLAAGRKYLRAGLYFLLAERMLTHKSPRRVEAYKRGIALYRRGLEYRRDPVEYIEVPYEGKVLPAIFSKAPGDGRKPCILHFDGLDLMKEIIYAAVADEFRRRGVSLLIVDHPGVGGALRLHDLHSGPDTERPAAACVDYLQTRTDIDPERIGVMALSLGGYYAPRAAAFEKRLKCCVAWGAIFDYGTAAAERLIDKGEAPVPAYAEHLHWVFGTKTQDELLKVVRQMTLEGVADKIECPLLVVHGENDRQVPLWHATKTIETATACRDKELKIFSIADGGSEHCGADNNTMVVDYMADWVAEKLGGSTVGL
jgi:alpha-beta hydrolase superfamily lysophospholipase